MSRKSGGWGQWFRVKLSHDEAQALYKRCDEQHTSPEALLRQAFIAFNTTTPCNACHCREKAQQVIGDPRLAVGQSAQETSPALERAKGMQCQCAECQALHRDG